MEGATKCVQLWVVVLLALRFTSAQDAGADSLWGLKAVLERPGCQYWMLKPDHSLPALHEFSVCVDVQRSINNSAWTAFTYLHPDQSRVELGLGGRGGKLHVWLFGMNWTVPDTLAVGEWCSVCITWSCSTKQLRLFTSGSDGVVMNVQLKGPACKLAAAGSLTLGAAHYFTGGKMEVESGTNLQGNVTLFRVWGKIRSPELHEAHSCTDGDALRWHSPAWSTHTCPPVKDDKLTCAWSLYEVKARVAILHSSGNVNTYEAREIAHHWLRQALPSNIYLRKVSVSPVPSSVEFYRERREDKGNLRDNPKVKRFDTLAHLTVIPSDDVGKVQDTVFQLLRNDFHTTEYILYTHPELLHIYSIDGDKVPESTPKPTNTHSEPAVTTTTSTTTTTQDTTTPVTTTTPNTITTQDTTTTSVTTSTPNTITTQDTTTTSVTTTTPTTTTTSVTTTTPTTTTTQDTTTTSVTTTTPIKTTTPTTTTTPDITTTSGTDPTSHITTPSVSPVSPQSTESFFKVNMNVTIVGSGEDPQEAILTWLYGTLSPKGIYVLNFLLTSPRPRTVCLEERSYQTKEAFLISEESHSCVFQMMVTGSSSIEETQRQIHALLDRPYSNGSLSLDADPEDILISYIQPGLCPRLTQQTRQGRYVWPWTLAQHTAWLRCEGDASYMAFRKCLLSAETSQAVWVPPELQRCPTVVTTISDLEHIEVTNDTAEDVLQMIEDILKEHDSLDEHELQTVLTKLQDVLNVTTVTPDIAEVIVSIMSNILNSKSNLQPFINSILNVTESVGDKMSNFSGESVSFVAPALALSVVNVDPEHVYNLTFGVTSVKSGLYPYPKVYINKQPFEGTVAFISLPPALLAHLPQNNLSDPRVQFQFYGVPALFKDEEEDQTLNTYVVSASVINTAEPVENLKEPVIFTLHHLDTHIMGKDVHCVYWDFNKNDGRGGWNPRGCWKHNVTTEYTTCMCDHLTHFGVLLDVSRTPIDEQNERILTVITYIGCGLSSFFLGVTVLTYSLLEKLRRDYPSQILLNLSIALLGLNLVFLTNSWFSAFAIPGLCVAIAAAQHYFLLASFSWMFLEAVNMYFALVKVFNVYVPSYILKFCVVGWGLPLVMCCLVLIVKQESYAGASFSDVQQTRADSEMFCWIQDDVVFYVSVVGFVGLVLLCNSSIFLVVLLQMKKMRVNQPAGTQRGLLQDLRAVASLTFLLGLTWTVAFFTWGSAKVPLLYVFSLLNSLQGFFIFVFHCLVKENVRKQWRVHLCFGRFKLQDHSDWSHTATVVAKPKPSQLPKFPMVASFRSSKSNSTQSSSLSSDSSQRQVSIRRPDLGVVYQQNLVLPRIHLTPSALSSADANANLPYSDGYEIHSWIPEEHDVYSS